MIRRVFSICLACLLALFVNQGFTQKTPAEKSVKLSDAQVEDIVRRSYQYVAMYNVIQKMALESRPGGMSMDGFNKPAAMTTLVDHTVKLIARPNNDTLYQGVVLDLRQDAVIVEYPLIDSKYVCLQISSYDHYTSIPLATSEGDFKKPTKILFYTDRTKGYQGQPVKGVDRIIKVDGDFLYAFLRAMPHQTDPARMERIVQALKNVKVVTLSEFQGKPAKDTSDAKFPAYGKTDGDVFANNLLEVMQFIFNHTTFDPDNAMDQAVLAAYKPLGVEPGKKFDAAKVAKLDGARFRKVASELAKRAHATWGKADPSFMAKTVPQMFMPKGKIDLETQVIQSVVGPIGLPAFQARYLPVLTSDGKPMNAMHDYVIRMAKDELPPAKAFWSMTLYDLKNGFFIPNDRKKYSIGENAGMKLNDKGGIEVYVAAEKPEGVPEENWLPINRKDEDMDIILRIYVPDPKKMKTWKAPKAEKLAKK
jgi:hypothetical protein